MPRFWRVAFEDAVIQLIQDGCTEGREPVYLGFHNHHNVRRLYVWVVDSEGFEMKTGLKEQQEERWKRKVEMVKKVKEGIK